MLLIRFLTLRSMRARPMRLLLSMFGIILGVAGMLAIAITNNAALDSVNRLFADTSGRAALIITPSGVSQELPENVLRIVVGIPGIETAIPVLRASTILADQQRPEEIGISFLGASAGGLLLQGIDPQRDMLARDYSVTAGRFLSSEPDAYEVVLVEPFAADNNLRLNDRIAILTPDGVERLRVVGFIAREGPGLTNNGSFGVLPLRTAQILFSRVGELDQIDLIVSQGLTGLQEVESLQATLQQRLGSSVSVLFPASQGQRMNQMLASYQIGLNFLSGIALFIGAFLVYNAFAMTVVERTREFGMLRTIGLSRSQVTIQVLIEAGLLGLVGSSAGVFLGVVLSRGMAQLMAVILGTDLDQIPVPLDALLVSLVIGLGVTLLASLIPARHASRISPMTALRVRAASREGWIVEHGWKAGLLLLAGATALLVWNPFAYDVQFRLGSLTVFALFSGATLVIPAILVHWERALRPLMKLVFGSSGELGSRNIQRARLRTTLTVAALLVGVAMIIVVHSMTASFSADLRSWVTAYLGGDLYISSSVPLRSDVARRIESVQGVAAVAPIRYLPVEWRLPSGSMESITLMAVEPASYGRVTRYMFADSNVDGEAAMAQLAEGDSVFISSVLAEKYGLDRGDHVSLRTRTGMRSFQVAAVVVDFYNQGLVINAGWNDMRRHFRVNDASTFLVKLKPGEVAAQVEERIDRLYGNRYSLVIETNEAIRSRAFTLMDQAFSMFDVLALIAVLVGSLGVVNTLTMNVMERTREIGMLRATGTTRVQVIRMILAEAGLMGLAGGLLGLIMGVLLARIFLLGMTAMAGYRLDFLVPWQGVLTGVVVALLVSQAAAFFPARRAAKTRILDAIHYE